ncbi:hypothetical protein HDF15_000090 [Granulicella mallensis]|uniref:Uncharacterized protein n=1 Tax=Granulicella mallensis TaxID=940614 RepID=A0A7W7ZKT4_9BACT|nr:hypothetical protein [Granulicella mallensis]
MLIRRRTFCPLREVTGVFRDSGFHQPECLCRLSRHGTGEFKRLRVSLK